MTLTDRDWAVGLLQLSAFLTSTKLQLTRAGGKLFLFRCFCCCCVLLSLINQTKVHVTSEEEAAEFVQEVSHSLNFSSNHGVRGERHVR